MTHQQHADLEAWKAERFQHNEVRNSGHATSDITSVFCHALVKEGDHYRRCHQYSYGLRGNWPVCNSHFRSKDLILPMGHVRTIIEATW